MTPAARSRVHLAPSDLAGLGAIQLALLLWLWLGATWAALPLLGFIALCVWAPFVPGLGFFLPVVAHGPRRGDRVALTFDDGPDPATTPALLALLGSRGLRATFFLVGERVRAHPDLVRAILVAGHEVGNHSDRHDPFLVLRKRARVAADVAACQRALAAHGVRPRVFRPPVGITSPRLRRALERAGLTCVTFDCRARDRGNRRVAGQAARLLARVRPGSILLLHDRAPRARGAGGSADGWIEEVRALLDGLADQGLRACPVGELLGFPATVPAARATAAQGGHGAPAPAVPAVTPAVCLAPADPVRDFYDNLAAGYDHEQAHGGGAALRRRELDVVRDALPALLPPGGRVLELGAGTGRFTQLLAERAAWVVAVDLSPRMLAALRARTGAVLRARLAPVVADLGCLPLRGDADFDLIAAYSVLEYAPDLAETLRTIAARLRPGAHLHVTTAHRCLFRFFVQVGNAMRQGVWLHARSRRDLAKALRRAGLEVVRVKTHHLRLGPFGGMLLEGVARRPAG